MFFSTRVNIDCHHSVSCWFSWNCFFFSQGANTWLSHPPHPFLDSCVSSTILLSFCPSSVILLWSLRVLLGSFNSDIRCQIFLSLPSLCWNHSTLSFCLIGQFLHPYLCQHPLGLFSPQPSLSSHYTLNQVSMRSRLQSFLFAAKHQPWHEVYPHPYICPCLTDTACSIHNDVTFLILIRQASYLTVSVLSPSVLSHFLHHSQVLFCHSRLQIEHHSSKKKNATLTHVFSTLRLKLVTKTIDCWHRPAPKCTLTFFQYMLNSKEINTENNIWIS